MGPSSWVVIQLMSPTTLTGYAFPGCTVPPMGFNPFREEKHGFFDVAMVVVALLVTLALVVWAFIGG